MEEHGREPVRVGMAIEILDLKQPLLRRILFVCATCISYAVVRMNFIPCAMIFLAHSIPYLADSLPFRSHAFFTCQTDPNMPRHPNISEQPKLYLRVTSFLRFDHAFIFCNRAQPKRSVDSSCYARFVSPVVDGFVN